MKKLLVLLVVLAMLFSLAACGGAPADSGSEDTGSAGDSEQETDNDGVQESVPEQDSFKIGVVIPSGDHGFTGESVAHAKMESEALMDQYDGLEIVVKAGLEASNQIESIDNLLAGQDVDLIMLWPMEGEALRSAAQTILDAGADLVIYDRLIDGFTGIVGEIMGDNVGIGGMMGEYLNEYYADEDAVQYLRFVGDSSTVTAQRSDGMDNAIDGKFEQVAETFVTMWSHEKAQEQMETWLNAKTAEEIEAIDLIVTHDDEIVDGLMNAIESYEGDAQINIKLITSVGGREDTLQKFEASQTGIEFTTFYFAPAFIREALRLSVAHLYGEEYTGANINDDPNLVATQYLIPSFSISNSEVATANETFDSYRASAIYEERYSIGTF